MVVMLKSGLGISDCYEEQEVSCRSKNLELGSVLVSAPQAAKCFNYAKWHKTSNSMFVVFVATFLLTRLVLFPFWWEWSSSALLHFLMQDPYRERWLCLGISAGWFTAPGCIRWRISLPFSATTSSMSCWPSCSCSTSTGLSSLYKCFTSCFSARCVSSLCAHCSVSRWGAASTNKYCFLLSFTFIHSLTATTGATKKRTTPTHRWNRSPNRVTLMALDSEAEQTVTDTKWWQELRKRANGQLSWRSTFETKAVESWLDFTMPQQWTLLLGNVEGLWLLALFFF